MALVKRVQTKPTRAEWLAAFVLVFPEVADDNAPATQEQAGCAWGCFAEETGRGAACWNFNVGNIRAFAGYLGDVIDLPGATEVVDGKTIVTGGAFRAYDSLEHGVYDFLETLKSDFPDAWEELRHPHPNPRALVDAMKRDRYFTGDVGAYAAAVASIAAGFAHEFAAELADNPPSEWPGKRAPAPSTAPTSAPVLECVDPDATPAALARSPEAPAPSPVPPTPPPTAPEGTQAPTIEGTHPHEGDT